MGLDSSQACINFCSGYSVFLEAHLQAIINSLECWQNIQTCRQASDDTTLGKSSGSRPNRAGRGGGSEPGRSQGPLSLLPPARCSSRTAGPSTAAARCSVLCARHPKPPGARGRFSWVTSSWFSPTAESTPERRTVAFIGEQAQGGLPTGSGS